MSEEAKPVELEPCWICGMMKPEGPGVCPDCRNMGRFERVHMVLLAEIRDALQQLVKQNQA